MIHHSNLAVTALLAGTSRLWADYPILADASGLNLPAELSALSGIGSSGLLIVAVIYLIRDRERDRADRERERVSFMEALQEQRDKHEALLREFLPKDTRP